jgi:hypothetical protein
MSCVSLWLGETERLAVGLEERIGFLSGMGFHSAQGDDLADRLSVVSIRFHLGVDVANILGEAPLLFFEAFDALNEKAQLIGSNIHVGSPSV